MRRVRKLKPKHVLMLMLVNFEPKTLDFFFFFLPSSQSQLGENS